jgi:hypothetical protein
MNSANPLVAAATDAPVDPWSGVWIAQDIETLCEGVKNGSWIEGTLGAVSAGLDALALISDLIGRSCSTASPGSSTTSSRSPKHSIGWPATPDSSRLMPKPAQCRRSAQQPRGRP